MENNRIEIVCQWSLVPLVDVFNIRELLEILKKFKDRREDGEDVWLEGIYYPARKPCKIIKMFTNGQVEILYKGTVIAVAMTTVSMVSFVSGFDFLTKKQKKFIVYAHEHGIDFHNVIFIKGAARKVKISFGVTERGEIDKSSVCVNSL